MIADTVDRKVDLQDAYKQTVETKFKLKLSAEIRLLETSLARLIKQVQTDVPAPEGIATIKARRAANIRWERERAQG
ncbi:hypothetical protein H7J89_15000 [Mycobacterium paraffinicum]|nr:hypothetical protein [Mycobacterium paraffinicum]